jgi:hypothetical protein
LINLYKNMCAKKLCVLQYKFKLSKCLSLVCILELDEESFDYYSSYPYMVLKGNHECSQRECSNTFVQSRGFKM